MIDYKELIKTFTEDDFTQKRINLHIHTNHSDGEADFDEIISQAEQLNYKYIAITDHNTMSGYENSKTAEILIPGVEFDVWCGYVFMHLLGYGVDKNNPMLKKFFAKSKQETKWDIIRLFSKRNIKELIKAIHNAGGIAVLAHPACCWCISMDRFVKKLISYGLDGIEVYYPYPRFRGILKFHNETSIKKIALKYNLIMTGGTDLHKKNL